MGRFYGHTIRSKHSKIGMHRVQRWNKRLSRQIFYIGFSYLKKSELGEYSKIQKMRKQPFSRHKKFYDKKLRWISKFVLRVPAIWLCDSNEINSIFLSWILTQGNRAPQFFCCFKKIIWSFFSHLFSYWGVHTSGSHILRKTPMDFIYFSKSSWGR